MGYLEVYREWCENPLFDEKTKEELLAIQNDEKEIEDRFYKELSFGTAGLRGVMGAGTNRMNLYTVGKATQGLANYICKMKGQEKGVAIAYDSRHNSKEFSEAVALIFAANGIKTYIFKELRPTPELSFTIRELGCISGVNITASHNPPEYNGYKAYWEDGAQVTPPHDTAIMDEVNAIKDYGEIRTISKEEAMEKGLLVYIGEEIDARYLEEMKKQLLFPEILKQEGKDIKIVYTPLHGAGNRLVRRLLKEIGCENVIVVPEQELPNGDFPTVSYPNPEAPESFAMALALAKKENVDLVLATDPDSDRIGVYVKAPESAEAEDGFLRFNGNMIGCFMEHYLLTAIKQKEGSLPKNGYVVRSIVTSHMVDAIATYHGVAVKECLTGFKWIGKRIHENTDTGLGTYLFGFEESFGYLVGTHARDKDAVVSAMTLCEALAYYRSQGKTMWDAMKEMYELYGCYEDKVVSLVKSGIEGQKIIANMMKELRGGAVKEVAGATVKQVIDYENGMGDIPASNVLTFVLEDGTRFSIRPSGTEPKIKMYIGVLGDTREKAKEHLEKMALEVLNVLNRMDQ